jgi:nucleoside-diphosphate-sugar epimerase
MKVFVAGGTGVIGSRTIPLLLAAGHQPTVVTRDRSDADHVRSLGATSVSVDLFVPAAVAAAVDGHDAVVNLATSIPPLSRALRRSAWATNTRLRAEASRLLVDGAVASGTQRFVQESICYPYVDAGDSWIDENGPREFNWAMASSRDAEAAATSFSGANRTAVVLRFGQLYSDDSAHTHTFNRLTRMHINPFSGPANSYLSWIHADDAAAAVVAALSIPDGIYNVIDDEPMTRRDTGHAVGAAVGISRLASIPIPRLLSPPVARALMRSQRVSNAKLRKTGSWAPTHRSIRGSWPKKVAA